MSGERRLADASAGERQVGQVGHLDTRGAGAGGEASHGGDRGAG